MRERMRTVLACTVALAIGIAGTAGASRIITGSQIKNGSIGVVDLSKSARRALTGKAGPQGPQGPAGGQGPAGPQSLGTVVRSQSFLAPPDDFARGTVTCPDGMVATGGSLSPGGLTEAFDGPTGDGRGWTGAALETGGFTDFSMLLQVVCAPGSAQVLAIGARHTIGQRELEAQAQRAH